MNEEKKQEGSPVTEEYVPIDLSVPLKILWAAKWKIVAFSLLCGLLMLAYMFTLPNVYRSTALIKPENQEGSRGGAGVSALASLGVPVGVPSKSEDVEVILKSEDLAIRVFRKYDLWSLLRPGEYDPKTKRIQPGGWWGRLLGDKGESKAPGDWDAIREGRSHIKVTSDRKTGVISVSFESPSAEGSAAIVRHYLDEAKSRLQEEALSRANRNKEFIQSQIAKTVDALTRDRLYALYGQEVEREMLARNREQFGFTVIDSPKVPDRKFGPVRGRNAALASVLSLFLGCVYYIFRGNSRRNQSPQSN